MAKLTTATMDMQLASEVTTLVSAWLITRTDNKQFRFTTAAAKVSIDIGDGNGVQDYSASEGYAKTAIQNNAELDVNNVEVLGVFDNQQLDETEVRRGLFDFADVRIFLLNERDTSVASGIVKMLRGTFGELISTPHGHFSVQLDSLEVVYTQELEERYSKDCRADLGDVRCRVPIQPIQLPLNTAVVVGDFFRIPAVPAPVDNSQILMNFEGIGGAIDGPGFNNIGTDGTKPTLVGTAQISTAQKPAGGTSTSSLLLDGNSDFVKWTDRALWTIEANAVTISTHFRLNSAGAARTICSVYDATTSQRSWYLRITSGNILQFEVYQGGASVDVTLTGTTVLTANTDHHAAIVRKTNGDWVLFLDGAIEAGPTTPTSNPFDSTANFRIGARESGGLTEFFDGHIDSFELLIGFARWSASFTPPTGNFVIVTKPQEDFGNRIYQVTVAGTTGIFLETPDTTVGNTHSQGGATLQAKEAWNRHATVIAVDPTEPRRKFMVTEYTPNTAHAAADRVLTTVGFPDDHLNFGGVRFDTGANAGRAMEVRDFVADDGITIEQVVELFTDMPFDVAVGDKLAGFPGCEKRLTEDCVARFDNGINHVGETFTATPDVLGQYPDAR